MSLLDRYPLSLNKGDDLTKKALEVYPKWFLLKLSNCPYPGLTMFYETWLELHRCVFGYRTEQGDYSCIVRVYYKLKPPLDKCAKELKGIFNVLNEIMLPYLRDQQPVSLPWEEV